MAAAQRRLPFGAEVVSKGVHFRVWAPRRKRVEVVVEADGDGDGGNHAVPLEAEDGGWFAGTAAKATVGSRYRYRLDGGQLLVPDPASRFQPEGPHGPSQVVDPGTFAWSDGGWMGRPRRGVVVSEIHLGTFTPEGTWAAAGDRLADLKDAGINCVEVMPISDFAGRHGWGYDGVNLYAPCRLYGTPDDARAFVDRAHGLGVSVILDVVYNHLGPDGNYVGELSETYISRKHKSEWGDSLNFDGDASEPVRDLFAENAAYWISEFHFDGLRLDAIQAVVDDSKVHMVGEVVRRARAAAGKRTIFIVAENEEQKPHFARPPAQGGEDLDGVWNDDFHHTARVAATGFREAYYTDYLGAPQEFLSCWKRGYLYQGQRYSWQKARRGQPATGLEPEQFVTYLDNHDQMANGLGGARLQALTSPGRFRTLTTMLLLGPGTPMLFQGQEFGATAPFLFFADHGGDLGTAVREGRAGFMAQFPSAKSPAGQKALIDPGVESTFRRCILDWGERARNLTTLALHRDLLAIRRDDPAIRDVESGSFDGAVLGPQALVLRFFGSEPRADRALVVNLGAELRLVHAPEPLLAPPEGARWHNLFSSNDPRYGGEGTAPIDDEEGGIVLPGESAVLLGVL